MKQVTLFLIFAIFSGNAAAEWTKVNQTAAFTMYIDKTAIIKNEKGNLVNLWRMNDYVRSQTTKSKGRFSLKIQHEYDCENFQLRVLGFYWYSGQMGEGEVVYFNNVPSSEQMPVIPDTYDEQIWNIACEEE